MYKSRSATNVRKSIRKDINTSIQYNLSKIDSYKKELNSVLENLDQRLLEVTKNS